MSKGDDRPHPTIGHSGTECEGHHKHQSDRRNVRTGGLPRQLLLIQ